MKKRIALLLGALLLLLGVFAACSTSVTSKTVRWDDEESYVFNIGLSDFNAEGSPLFNSYDIKITQQDNSEATLKCYKDSVVQMSTSTPAAGGSDQESAIFASSDQIRPLDVSGRFEMQILPLSETTANRKLVTKQVVYSQYSTETLEGLNCLSALEKYIVAADSSENPFENNEGRTTLRSETNSEVIFANDANQLPVSSVKENKGFYIGKVYQGISDYKYETTYDFSARKVQIKKNDGEAETRKLSLAKGGSCIDSSQLLLYIRSLDKSASAFADSPSVAVYDPIEDRLLTAVFALNRDFYALLNNNGADYAAALQSVSVTVGGRPFMTQYNLPNLTESGEGGQSLDFLPGISEGKVSKYTTVKFRSGYFSYELSAYDQQVLEAIDLQKKSVK